MICAMLTQLIFSARAFIPRSPANGLGMAKSVSHPIYIHMYYLVWRRMRPTALTRPYRLP